jgi:hypothetical protein
MRGKRASIPSVHGTVTPFPLPLASLYLVAHWQSPPKEGVVTDKALVETLRHYCQYAIAAYDITVRRVEGVAFEDIIYSQPQARALKPSYLIADDKARRQIVLAIRGTHSFGDVVTDVAAVPTAFFGGL